MGDALERLEGREVLSCSCEHVPVGRRAARAGGEGGRELWGERLGLREDGRRVCLAVAPSPAPRALCTHQRPPTDARLV